MTLNAFLAAKRVLVHHGVAGVVILDRNNHGWNVRVIAGVRVAEILILDAPVRRSRALFGHS